MVAGYAGRHFGLAMSIVNIGGTLAFGLGPLYIAYIVGRWGLEVSPLTAIPGLAVMVVLFRIVPMPAGEGLRAQGHGNAEMGNVHDLLQLPPAAGRKETLNSQHAKISAWQLQTPVTDATAAQVWMKGIAAEEFFREILIIIKK